MRNKILILIVSVLFFWCVYWEESMERLEYVPWEIVVKYRNINQNKWLRNSYSIQSNSVLSIDDELKSNNLEIKEKLDDSGNIALVGIMDDKSVDEAIALLNDNSNVEYAEPNYIRYLFYMDDFISNDSLKSHQWWLDYISWKDAFEVYSWKISNGHVAVWVIDNWVNYFHPDLQNSMWSVENCVVDWENIEWCMHWYDFFHDMLTPLPNRDDHGTHVAWIIGAWLDDLWIIWVNPYAKIASLKIGNDKSLTSADELRAINFAIDNWIKIINASYWASSESKLEKQAIQEFWENGWLFITAAGNGDINNVWQDVDIESPIYPCKYDLDNIICVAAIDSEWDMATYSNYWAESVDIAAPWSNILSTVITWLSDFDDIYSETFSGCKSSSIVWWENWSCYRWSKKSQNYGYVFSDFLKSPIISIWEDMTGVYLSFSISCDSTNVWIQYSKDWENFDDVGIFWYVVSSWKRYNLLLPDDYYTSNFMFKLYVDGDNSQCAIDDVEIYEDPYVFSDDAVYGKMSWTSMATPYVVWLASLVWSVNPKLSYQDVKSFIMEYWDENVDLNWKIVSWKTIDVKKTLDAVQENIVPKPTSLVSSRTWVIKWDSVDWAVQYYYEVLDWNEVVLSWMIGQTLFETNLAEWDYLRRVQWIDDDWNISKFWEYYICKKPEIQDINLLWWECSNLVWHLDIEDNCSDMYDIIWLNWDESEMINPELTQQSPWTLLKGVYVQNSFWEKTNIAAVTYSREDILPSLEINLYEYPTVIKSTSKQKIWNLISLFWANDWECWLNNMNVISVSCDLWTPTLVSNVLSITVPTSQKWTATCSIIFEDDESNQVEWTLKYNFDTIKSQNWWWGGWWGWWGWGWWWGGWWGSVTWGTDNQTHWTSINNQEKNAVLSWSEESLLTWGEVILEKPRMLDLFDNQNKENEKSDFDFSWYNNANPSDILSNWYTVEFNNAYVFAYRAWITTMGSIKEANMNWKLTRIAMAKMLSNYAMNVLWKAPANLVVPKFSDVSQKLDDDYGWAVTLSYQLWIMWKWITEFRPYDTVTRAEFATALSRMLYGTKDSAWNYYASHLDKLYREWIITNTNPKLLEHRWYVMIMLMRSAKS